ncbi:unnamed protein product [Blepharisma stoltei]|uniref:Uncharacterized protein n=1 Tax=Blepharisma stoltei TaxID=1481888 RepID=A0AAU9KCH7_9CILI|nr:unnamed protein product [Blepharisma stoltei]
MASEKFLERFKNKASTLGRTGEIDTRESEAVAKTPDFLERLNSTLSVSPSKQLPKQQIQGISQLKLPKLENREVNGSSKTPRPIIKPPLESTSRILAHLRLEDNISPLRKRTPNKSAERLPDGSSKSIVNLKSKMDKMKNAIQLRAKYAQSTERSHTFKEKLLPSIYRYPSETRRGDHSFLKPSVYSSFGHE